MAIYFVRAGKTGPVKIGYTAGDVLKRVAQMQIGSPEPMALLGVMEGDKSQERKIQAQFKGSHLRGEWFLVNEALNTFLATVPVPAKEYVAKTALQGARMGGRAFKEGGYRRGRPRGISDANMAEIKSLIETTSMPVTDIARKFKTNPQNIHFHFPELAKMRQHKVKLGRRTKVKKAVFLDVQKRLETTKEPIASIAKRIKMSPPFVNHWFPGWRIKTKTERAAHRKAQPFPEA